MHETTTAVQLLPPVADAAGSGVSLAGLALGLTLLLLGALLSLAQRAAGRVGLSPRFTLARWGRVLRGAGGLVLVLVFCTALVSGLPPPWAMASLALLVAFLSITSVLQNTVAAAYVQLRLQLREGHRVRVGAIEGQVRALAWDRVTLWASDGTLHHVPNRVLLTEPVEVRGVRGAVPLELCLPAAAADELARLRETVALLPYRVPGTPIQVQPDGDAVRVRCVLWSEPARFAAESLLRASQAGHR